MAKRTLLDMTQSILSDMTSDKVDSINDTVESEQVASIIKDTYFNLLGTMDKIPEHKELFPLTALSDSNHPNYMQLPSNVNYVEWIKYNVSIDGKQEYKTIEQVTPDEFTARVLERNSTDSNVDTITDFSGVPLLIVNDKMPNYYTTFDDFYLVFDSYNTAVESTLEASKSMGYGTLEPVWSHVDAFIPDLDTNLFPLLYNEAKAYCFATLKEAVNPSAERTARQQKVAVQNNKTRTKEQRPMPDFGRKR